MLSDELMLLKLRTENFVSKEVLYHSASRMKHQHQAQNHQNQGKKSLNTRKDTLWHIHALFYKQYFYK